MKNCSVCNIEKPLNEFSFTRGKFISRCKSCDRLKKREARKLRSHSQIDRKHWLKKAYGLSPEDYINMFDFQKGRCAICNIHQVELNYNLVVDHNHVTGKIRGLLCKRCNSALGLLDENLERLEKCKEYLNER